MLVAIFSLLLAENNEFRVYDDDSVQILLEPMISIKRPIPLSIFSNSQNNYNGVSSLAENMLGYDNTAQKIMSKFKINKECEILIDLPLNKTDQADFRALVANNYSYRFSINGRSQRTHFSASSLFGQADSINNHVIIRIFYTNIVSNFSRIVGITANSQSDSKCGSQNGTSGGNRSLLVTYSVEFIEKAIVSKNIMLNDSSILIILCVNIVLVFWMLSIIAKRVQLSSSSIYMDSNWYLLRGDIFRPPRNILVLCSFVSFGVQTLVSLILVTLVPYSTVFSFLNFLLIVFPICGFAGGSFSLWLFRTIGGLEWRLLLIYTISISPLILIGLYILCSIIYIASDSSAALSFSNIVKLVVLCVVHFISSVLGVYVSIKVPMSQPPYRTHLIGRRISNQPFFLDHGVLYTISGIIVYLQVRQPMRELAKCILNDSEFFINHRSSLFFLLQLFFSSSFVSLTISYIMIENQNHKWWNNAFSAPATSAIFFFVDTLYFIIKYVHPTDFSGLIIYGSISAIIGSLMYVFCGVSGWLSTFTVLWKSYKSINKNENQE